MECKATNCFNTIIDSSGYCVEHSGEDLYICKGKCSNVVNNADTYCPTCAKTDPKAEPKALDKQVGGQQYKKHSIQPWHIIDDYQLDFYLGNTVKYVLRDKGAKVEDLQKAIHYLERKIELLQENPNQAKLCLE